MTASVGANLAAGTNLGTGTNLAAGTNLGATIETGGLSGPMQSPAAAGSFGEILSANWLQASNVHPSAGQASAAPGFRSGWQSMLATRNEVSRGTNNIENLGAETSVAADLSATIVNMPDSKSPSTNIIRSRVIAQGTTSTNGTPPDVSSASNTPQIVVQSQVQRGESGTLAKLSQNVAGETASIAGTDASRTGTGSSQAPGRKRAPTQTPQPNRKTAAQKVSVSVAAIATVSAASGWTAPTPAVKQGGVAWTRPSGVQASSAEVSSPAGGVWPSSATAQLSSLAPAARASSHSTLSSAASNAVVHEAASMQSGAAQNEPVLPPVSKPLPHPPQIAASASEPDASWAAPSAVVTERVSPRPIPAQNEPVPPPVSKPLLEPPPQAPAPSSRYPSAAGSQGVRSGQDASGATSSGAGNAAPSETVSATSSGTGRDSFAPAHGVTAAAAAANPPAAAVGSAASTASIASATAQSNSADGQSLDATGNGVTATAQAGHAAGADVAKRSTAAAASQAPAPVPMHNAATGTAPVAAPHVVVEAHGNNAAPAGLLTTAPAPVSASPASASTHAAVSSSGTASPSDTFAALDRGASIGAPTWTHAAAQHAEAGFHDPSLGWVGVRADLNPGGVHATLVPSSADAAQVLDGHVAGLTTHLSEEHAPVVSLSMSSPGAESSGGGMGQTMHQGGGGNPPQGSFTQETQMSSRQSAPHESSASTTSATAASSALSASAATGGVSGTRISVMA